MAALSFYKSLSETNGCLHYSFTLTFYLLIYSMDKQVGYEIADVGFFVFHIALIIFNLFGWIPSRLRKWNLVSLMITAFSWFVLGIFYGFGYCFLTDWHWQVREELRYSTESTSYIHFLLTEVTGFYLSESTVNILTAVLFFAACAVSIALNIRDHKNRH